MDTVAGRGPVGRRYEQVGLSDRQREVEVGVRLDDGRGEAGKPGSSDCCRWRRREAGVDASHSAPGVDAYDMPQQP